MAHYTDYWYSNSDDSDSSLEPDDMAQMELRSSGCHQIIDPDFYYHYTTHHGKIHIKYSKQLLPSTPNQFAGNLGNGVYVSDCHPSTKTSTLRYQLFKKGKKSDFKMVCYVKLRKSDVKRLYPDVKQYADGRRSFRINTHQQPMSLNGIEHSFGDR
ncbi:uncharacterized protein LOC134845062 [Symsagittifera roscoffensis]|uniref:uncharacterized protein LOC134845062 n=1 Tax=Symsagittifera roscoffensis TaxID=84072 RepID=UPI00307C0E9E